MVRKLIKHELNAFSRSMLPMEIMLLGIAVLTRFVQLFENDTRAYDIVRTSAIVVLVIAIVVCLVMSVVLSIKRFHTNMFTSEGYLTMTLPVTPSAHITAKLTVAVISLLITVLTVCVAGSIAMLGDVLVEVLKAVGFIWKNYYNRLKAHAVLYCIDIFFCALSVVVYQFLLLYGCISLGQMAKKRRVLAAFGVYFGYYILTQIIGTVMIIIVADRPDWLHRLGVSVFEWAELHPYASIHMLIWGITVFCAALSTAWFFINRYVLKNRLNLE